MANPLHFLVVEDDPDDVDLLQEALQEYGVSFTTDIIGQGDQVLPHLEKNDALPDVIILDLNLARLHGKDVLQLLKASPRLRPIPVVILTTSSAIEEINFCKRAGAHSFLTKPISMQGFRAITEAIVVAATRPLLN